MMSGPHVPDFVLSSFEIHALVLGKTEHTGNLKMYVETDMGI